MLNKTCRQCQKEFVVADEDLEFYKKISPTFAGKTFEIPAPDECPDCRLQHRLAFRNNGKFFSRKCDLSGKAIISMYSPDRPYKVYDHDVWWSDQWDPMDYGRDFDFNRSFFEQLNELFCDVPHSALTNINSENSYYCNHGLNLKNCYLLAGAADDENCIYGQYIIGCHDTLDSVSVTNCEYCYEGITSSDCMNCKYFANSRNCAECFMIEDCQSCQNCIGCFGLKNKQFYIFNESVGKEKYEEFLRENLSPMTRKKISQIQEKFDELKKNLPHRYAYLYSCENTTGDMATNCNNCRHAFATKNSENAKFILANPNAKHTYDCCFCAPEGTQFSYYSLATIGQSFYFTWLHWYGSNSFYTMECYSSKDCFACVGLRNKQYCIFNKQYTKEEYESEVSRIIEHMQKNGEWGNYLPAKYAFYGYSESVAVDFFPLTKDEALAGGFAWSDFVNPTPNVKKIFGANEIPESIDRVDDSFINCAIKCEVTDRPFIITANELAAYRQQGIPLPKRHPEQRHKDRMKLRNPIQLWPRKCENCSGKIMSIYAPDRSEKVYCEKCYQKEVL